MSVSEPRPHPFVPVVRWIVFPAAAGLAGAAGGSVGAPEYAVEAAMTGGLLSVSAALGVAVSARPLRGMATVPVLAGLGYAGVYPLYLFLEHGLAPPDPWGALTSHLLRVFPPIWFVLTLLAQASAHYFVLRWRPGTLPATAVYGAAGLVVGLVSYAVIMPGRPLHVLAFTALATLAQVVPMRLSQALSARLAKT
jgi:hypothetical protein